MSGLTDQEKKVLQLSAELYNELCSLPRQHPADLLELEIDIHRIQNRVMARVAVRLHPEIFGGTE